MLNVSYCVQYYLLEFLLILQSVFVTVILLILCHICFSYKFLLFLYLISVAYLLPSVKWFCIVI